MIDTTASLLASAEISAGLLGFAAIVSVFRQNLSTWQPEGRFWVMLVLAASSFTLALLPIPFLAYGGNDQLAWSVPAVGLIVASVGVVQISFWGQRIQVKLGIKTHRPTLVAFLVLIAIAAAMGLLNLGVIWAPAFWRHMTGLVALQLATVLFFVRLLRLWLTEPE